MTICIQSVAMFGSELWRKEDHGPGTIGRADELQLLVNFNQEARVTTGCFRTTTLGTLSMEPGLREATTRLENRQRQFGLRLLSLPQGDQVRETIGTPIAIRRAARQRPGLWCKSREESSPWKPDSLDAELLQEEDVGNASRCRAQE